MNTNQNGGMNIRLANIHFDPTGRVQCKVRDTKSFCVIDKDGNGISANQQIEGNESIITIENLNAWEYILLTNQ